MLLKKNIKEIQFC